MLMSADVVDTHRTQRRVRCAHSCGDHGVCRDSIVASKIEVGGGACPLAEVVPSQPVRHFGICSAAFRGDWPRTLHCRTALPAAARVQVCHSACR